VCFDAEAGMGLELRRSLVVVATAAVLGGCQAGDGSAAAWAGTVDTLPGGTVVVTNPAHGVWDSSTTWRLVEELRIGAADGDGPDVFSDVHDLAVDDAGRIYVLQRTARTVHVFDAGGAFVRAIGRPGKGPGELETPTGMLWDPAGRLWIADSDNARYTAYDTTGAVLASHRRPLTSFGWRWDAGFMPDGCLLEQEVFGSAAGFSIAYLRLDSTFAVKDTLLASPPAPDDTDGVFIFRRGTSTTYVQIPFRPQRLGVLDARGFHWSADPAAYRLVQRTLDGDSTRVIARAYDTVPVVDGDLAEMRETYRSYIESGQGWDESRIPQVKPAFSALVVADDGHLWLRLHRPYGDSLAAFDVFDPEGRHLGPVRAPVTLGESAPVLVRGDAVYGVTYDVLDVPAVVRLRLVRGAGARQLGF
jgi:hypothetical protein